MSGCWEIKSASKQLDKIIDETLANGAQIITNVGLKVAVMLSMEEFEQMYSKPFRSSQSQNVNNPESQG